MRTFICSVVLLVVVVCVVCYEVGRHAGMKTSPSEEQQRGLVTLALAAYDAAEATNWIKVRSCLSIELVGFTHEYERRFGVPTGTNIFVQRFAVAKSVADRIQSQLVPVGSIGAQAGSNVTVQPRD